MGATFIKAYSKRDSHDNSKGYSDHEARVGRDGKTCHLGYKAHIVAPANENEKRHAYKLLDKTLEATKGRVKTLWLIHSTPVGG